MTRARQVYFIGAAFLIMLAWEVYVELLAPRTALDYIHLYHVDKAFHLIGGAFVGALGSFIFGVRRLTSTVATILFVSLVWEAGELLFDRSVIYFFSKSKDLWLLDTIGDTFFGVVGALFYYFSVRSEP